MRQVANQKIIVVEDEADILEVLEFNLAQDGFDVLCSQEGEKGLELIRREKPDLVLLDLMLPDLDGLEICRRLKSDAATQDIPIVMVTAKGKESDIVLGLGLGADDYITKPFNVGELIARVKAVLRRAAAAREGAPVKQIVCQGIAIDADKHEVLVDGQLAELTVTEFRVLYTLASSPGRVFTRDQLMEQAMGDEVIVLDRNIDVHIGAVRKKLGRYRDLVETVWGVGYRFREQDK